MEARERVSTGTCCGHTPSSCLPCPMATISSMSCCFSRSLCPCLCVCQSLCPCLCLCRGARELASPSNGLHSNLTCLCLCRVNLRGFWIAVSVGGSHTERRTRGARVVGNLNKFLGARGQRAPHSRGSLACPPMALPALPVAPLLYIGASGCMLRIAHK